MKIVDLSFFESDTVKVAKELIGKILSVESDAGILTGRIVETEAYLGSEDPAAHSFNGKTKRTSPMFEKGGNIYIYIIYGIYYCLNFSTEKEGIGNAILIRAIEPLDGLDIMKKKGISIIFTIFVVDRESFVKLLGLI